MIVSSGCLCTTSYLLRSFQNLDLKPMKNTIVLVIALSLVLVLFQNSKGQAPIAENASLLLCCNQYSPWEANDAYWSLFCIDAHGVGREITITRNCCMSMWAMNGYNPPSANTLCSSAQPCPKY